MSELLKCPHCGGGATTYRFFDADVTLEGRDRYYVFIRCTVCGATGSQKEITEDVWKDWDKIRESPEYDDAVESWNLRTTPEDIQSMIDEAIKKSSYLAKVEGGVIPLVHENDTSTCKGTTSNSTDNPK